MVAENSRVWRCRGNEAKIEDPVGLVQHKNLDIRQNEALSLDQIEEAPRSRYENVDTRRELSLLGPNRDTAEYDRRRKPQPAAAGAEAVDDLARQVSGGAKTQHPPAAQ